MEYLIVYAMAITIIVLVAAIFFYSGIFSASNYAPSNSVSGFTGFSVTQECIAGGALEMAITNENSYPVEITRINTTSSITSNLTVSDPFSIILQSQQSQLFFVPFSCASISSLRYSSSVTIAYITGSSINGTQYSSGTLSGLTLSNSTPATVASFNPNQHSYVLVHSSSSLNITGSITVVAWYYLVGALGNYIEGLVWKCETLFPGGNGPAGGYNLALGWATGYDFEDGPQNSSGWTSGASGSDTGRWIQLVGIKSGGTNTLQLYFNGIANGPNSAATWPLTDSVENLTIGASESPSLGSFFNGSISNVQIYNTALSNAQVQQLYSEGLSGAPLPNTGLVAWWPLNGNANDFSGNGNNGITTNVSWVSP